MHILLICDSFHFFSFFWVGNSYEKVAILEWLLSNPVSPITRNPLSADSLVPNRALKEGIELFKANNPMYGLPESVQAVLTKSSIHDDSLSVDVFANAEHLMVTVGASASLEPSESTPSDICCVVDVSGSMGCEVQLKNSSGENESFGITQLDLVKHALKTIVECLGHRDRLSLVSFNTTAKVCLELTLMDPKGKTQAKQTIDSLASGGGTNIYDGLLSGMDILSVTAALNRNAALFLLTDGVSNYGPPKGEVNSLLAYIDKQGGSLPFTINTFGFGYDLDSVLLDKLAQTGNGSFAFIPDGSFVGTIFINALSNCLSSVAKDVSISIELPTDEHTTDLSTHHKCELTSWGIVYYFGSIIYGQSKVIIIPLTGCRNDNTPFCECTLKYVKVTSNSIAEPVTVSCTHDSKEDVDKSLVMSTHIARLSTVNMILSCIPEAKLKNEVAISQHISNARALIQGYIASISSSKASVATKKEAEEFLTDLLTDVDGQVTEALMTEKYFCKWGCHYLPSLARAHLLQVCNNFKDPGVQHYGGTLFDSLRDRLHDTFCQLPPPTPSAHRAAYNRNTNGGTTTFSMASFSTSTNPCFHENCLVRMHDNSHKTCKSIVRGDVVATQNGKAAILYVLKTVCKGGMAELVHFPATGLMITPYHPMLSSNNRWKFPCDVHSSSSLMECGAVYSFVLEEVDQYSMNVNDTWCVTMGHDIFVKNASDALAAERIVNKYPSLSLCDVELLSHPYFGNRSRIVRDMEVCLIAQKSAGNVLAAKYYEYTVIITPDNVIRDVFSGLICGIKPTYFSKIQDGVLDGPTSLGVEVLV